MTASPHVIVIGAGLAGLATGWRLARRGAAVTLVDVAPHSGGRLRAEHHEGFELVPTTGTVSGADRRLAVFARELGLGELWLPLRPVDTAIVHRGALRAFRQRGLADVRRIPGVGWREGWRVTRLQRLMARYADALDFANPAAAARLDDRSLWDFGELYFGRRTLERWLIPRVEASAPGEVRQMSRVQFLISERRAGSADVGLPGAAFSELVERAASAATLRLSTEALCLHGRPGSGALRLETSAGVLEGDAAVLATDAPSAARLAEPLLVTPERDHLRAVRYAAWVALAVGLRPAPASRAREIWVPRSESPVLARVLLEPGPGRVPAGHGLAWLRARGELVAQASALPDDALCKQLLESLDALLPDWLPRLSFTRVFRLPRAAPRFDVGHYRALARFESVVRDGRAAGRGLYFAGDHLIHPSPEGAVISGERAARAVAEDLGLA